MPDSQEVKFARLEGKVDNLLEKLNHVNTTLDKDFVTKDQLALLLAPYEVQRKLFSFIAVGFGLQIIGLIFFFIQRLIERV